MTPYAQALIPYVPANAQASYVYDYQRYAKDPNTALLLTILLGSIGGEAYYMGEIKRGVLFALALFSGIGLFVTVPMWIVRCFTIQNECDSYNDYIAYQLACRYAALVQGAQPHPAAAGATIPQPAGNPMRRPISGVPATIAQAR